MYIERYLRTELLNSPSRYFFFQTYNLLAYHFYWTSESSLLVVISTFLLCQVSALQLRYLY
jgi:hypothetical protein